MIEVPHRIPNVHPIRSIREPIEIVLPCRSKIKKWAFENAWVLIVMAAMFAVTWIVMIIYGVMNHV